MLDEARDQIRGINPHYHSPSFFIKTFFSLFSLPVSNSFFVETTDRCEVTKAAVCHAAAIVDFFPFHFSTNTAVEET